MSLGKRDKLEENFLVTDIPPLSPKKGEKTINDCFREEIKKADRVEIFVAYCSGDSITEIDKWVESGDIKSICLILGVYFFIGFRESLYTLVIQTHTKWQEMGLGEIRLVDFFPHHGKLYCFYKDGEICSSIIGSANLSFLITKKMKKPRQYEIGQLTKDPRLLRNHKNHIKLLQTDRLSKTVSFLERYRIVHTIEETNREGKEATKTKITCTKNY